MVSVHRCACGESTAGCRKLVALALRHEDLLPTGCSAVQRSGRAPCDTCPSASMPCRAFSWC